MSTRRSRREFLKQNALSGIGFWAAAGSASAQSKSPNEQLDVASIGVGGQGRTDVKGVAATGANIVALCDVDDNNSRAKESYKKFPRARRFHDFREMFDKMREEIDAVTVSTPDHSHAVATMMAMKLGKHVYTQKPLAHDVYEARMLTQAAKEHKIVTQMGNQGTSKDGLREAVEVIRSGAIGPVREIHCWTNRPGRWWRQGAEAILAMPAVKHGLRGAGDPQRTAPRGLKWDLWLGTAPERPYQPNYLPKKWRGWWDFGCGALGDMGCHTMNIPFMACRLVYPTSIEAEVSEYNAETFPKWSIIRYEFPARGELPSLKLTWYDGGEDKPARVNRQLTQLTHGLSVPASGSLLIGDRGALFSPGDNGNDYKLLPSKDFEGHEPPAPSLPRVAGKHYEEWVRACLAGEPERPMANFSYAGPLTETVLLGCVAMRVHEKLIWDGPNLKVTNVPEANEFVRREYRRGWKL